jgi:hypothetical protein
MFLKVSFRKQVSLPALKAGSLSVEYVVVWYGEGSTIASNPEPTWPRINSCLFIHYSLLGLYSRVTRVLFGLKAHTSLTTQ